MKNTLIGAAVLLLAACNAENTVVNEKISVMQENEAVKTSVVLEYPQKGDEAALSSIRRQVADLLIKDYKGQLSDGQKILQQFVSGKMTELAQAEGYIPAFKSTYTAEVKVIVQTPKFITYEKSAEVFTGGAHGMSEWAAASIRKSDGVLLNEHILNERVKSPEFKQLLKQGAEAYFTTLKGAYYQCKFQPETLQSQLFEDFDADSLPLPQAKPFLSDKGVGFVYMPYEIASYSEGQIAFILPYEAMKPYLTAEVWNLVAKQENKDAAVTAYVNDYMAAEYQKYLALPEHKACE